MPSNAIDRTNPKVMSSNSDQRSKRSAVIDETLTEDEIVT